MTAPSVPTVPNVDREILREAIQEEYEAFASVPHRGFHFHTGRPSRRVRRSSERTGSTTEQLRQLAELSRQQI